MPMEFSRLSTTLLMTSMDSVAGTNIPVAPEAVALAGPVAPAAAPLVAPVAPMETPEVAAARAEHLAAHAEAQANSVEKREAEPIDGDYQIPLAPVLQLPVPIVHNAPAPVLNHFVQAIPAPAPFAAPIPNPNFLPVNQIFAPEQFAFVPAPIAAPAPFPLAAPAPFPLTAPVPVAPIVQPPSSQFHAQDEFGQFSFGYQNINSAKSESKDAFGVTRGSYQYVDANNVVQTVHYTADDINGFRVAATNVPVAPALVQAGLPVAPAAPAVAPLVAPVPVVETPEVSAARAEHLAAHEKAKADVAAQES